MGRFAQGTEIEAMQRGNLEVGMILAPQDIAALIPEYSIFTNGYLMRDAKHLDAVYDGDIGTEYSAKVAADLGLQIVRSPYLGSRQLILVKPRDVKTPADLAGLKPSHAGLRNLAVPWQCARRQRHAAGLRGNLPRTPDRHHRRLREPAGRRHRQQVLRSEQAGGADHHMVSNTFFTVAKTYWDGLSDDERKAIATAEAAAKAYNDSEVIKAEAEAVKFLESQGMTVVTPDVASFRNQVQQKFLGSDSPKTWPAGLLDRINAAGA